jgi:hypothetical protein
MAEVRFKISGQGKRDIRYWNSTAKMLEAVALTIADAANSSLELNGPGDLSPGYAIRSKPGKPDGTLGRWRVSVAAVTPHAIRHNAVHNTLLRVSGIAAK